MSEYFHKKECVWCGREFPIQALTFSRNWHKALVCRDCIGNDDYEHNRSLGSSLKGKNGFK